MANNVRVTSLAIAASRSLTIAMERSSGAWPIS
jgi:hypothetical protein